MNTVRSRGMWRPIFLACALVAVVQPQELLTLEVRVFDQYTEVTADTRVTIHAAGDRGAPVAQIGVVAEGGALMQVPAGIYDAQAVQHRQGRVINARWAERLIVMPYPDEAGHHLQVINFATGYGALQIRPAPPFEPGDTFILLGSAGRGQYEPVSRNEHGYVLFVVPAGEYDMQVTRRARTTWHPAIDVPLDRTRFLVVP